MAVSGSGGWVPSRRVYLKDNQLTFVGYAQNKPRSIVYKDMYEAAQALLGGKRIELHYYADNVVRLNQILASRTVV